jgi:hypothetical protein
MNSGFRELRPATLAAYALVLALSSASLAQDLTRITQGLAARADDFLGRSVATDGTRIAAGVPEYDLVQPNGSSISGAGAIAVFERVDGGWSRTALVQAEDASTADVLGEWVALDGALLIASAANVGLLTPAPWTGAAYIFERSLGTASWTQRAKLLPANPSEFMEGGLASDIDAPTRTAVVGARLADDAAPDAGSVTVFREVDGDWTSVQELRAPDAAPGDAFGYRVAIDGNLLAIATPATDSIAESTGSVYVFERSSPTAAFEFRARLMAGDADYRDRFGIAVDVDAATEAIVVGAVGDDNLPPAGDQGAAYVFRRHAQGWSQEAKLVASDRQPLDAFGTSIAIDGDRVVVGAVGVDLGRGAAYLFERTGSTWTELSKFTSPSGSPGDGLGGAVAVSGLLIAAGAQGHDDPLTNAGACYAVALAGRCAGDLDGNGSVDASDIGRLLDGWGASRRDNPQGDIDGDGTVGAGDLAALLSDWGPCPAE